MAAEPTETWADLIEAFDPFTPLSDELGHLYYRRSEDTPARRIRSELEGRPSAQTKFILIGARGSGKTTELWALARQMEGHRYSVGIDLSLAGIDDPSAFEVLLLTAMRLLLVLKNIRPKEARPLEGDLEKVYKAARRKDSEKKLEIDQTVKVIGTSLATLLGTPLPGAAGQVAAEATRLGRHVLASRRARLDVEATDAGADLLEVFQGIAAALEKVIGLPLLVLIDGLDMVFDPQRVYPLFAQAPFLADASVAFVMVGPISILPSAPLATAIRSRMRTVALNNLPLHHLSDPERMGSELVRSDEAFEGFSKLFEKRVQAGAARADGEPLLSEADLRALTTASGGVTRTFVRLVQETFINAKLRGDASVISLDVERAITKERRDLQANILQEDALSVLKATLRKRILPSHPPGRAQELLYEGYILHHENGQSWYRPHEILVATIEGYEKDDAG